MLRMFISSGLPAISDKLEVSGCRIPLRCVDNAALIRRIAHSIVEEVCLDLDAKPYMMALLAIGVLALCSAVSNR